MKESWEIRGFLFHLVILVGLSLVICGLFSELSSQLILILSFPAILPGLYNLPLSRILSLCCTYPLVSVSLSTVHIHYFLFLSLYRQSITCYFLLMFSINMGFLALIHISFSSPLMITVVS